MKYIQSSDNLFISDESYILKRGERQISQDQYQKELENLKQRLDMEDAQNSEKVRASKMAAKKAKLIDAGFSEIQSEAIASL